MMVYILQGPSTVYVYVCVICYLLCYILCYGCIYVSVQSGNCNIVSLATVDSGRPILNNVIHRTRSSIFKLSCEVCLCKISGWSQNLCINCWDVKRCHVFCCNRSGKSENKIVVKRI